MRSRQRGGRGERVRERFRGDQWNLIWMVSMDYSYKDKSNNILTSMPLFCDHSSQPAHWK